MIKNKKQNVKTLMKAYQLAKQVIASQDEQIKLLSNKGMALFRVPEKITILNETYEVKIEKDCKDLGLVNYQTKIITLKEDSDILNTFLHEVSHIINHKLILSKDSELFANVNAVLLEQIISQMHANIPASVFNNGTK